MLYEYSGLRTNHCKVCRSCFIIDLRSVILLCIYHIYLDMPYLLEVSLK